METIKKYSVNLLARGSSPRPPTNFVQALLGNKMESPAKPAERSMGTGLRQGYGWHSSNLILNNIRGRSRVAPSSN